MDLGNSAFGLWRIGLPRCSKLQTGLPLCQSCEICTKETLQHLLDNSIRLWLACRLIETPWQCCTDDQLPPFVDYQLTSIVISRILTPLETQVRQVLLASLRRRDWYSVFLTSFILLHNYEEQMRFFVESCRGNQQQVRWPGTNHLWERRAKIQGMALTPS